MKIDVIYVAGFKHDVHFTRTCVASIRRWYPDIAITLIKDRFYGDYSTRDIERNFNCRILQTGETCFGWGFGKLEPLFLPAGQRFLVLDSDIVFVGPVLERLEAFSENFVVQLEEPWPEFIKSHYFDVDKLRDLDPDFVFPGYTFNTGQWVGTSGCLHRDDFSKFAAGRPPKLTFPEIFKLGEQGLLNYVLMKNAASGRISLVRDEFMEVGSAPNVASVELARLRRDNGYPFLIHWCGLRKWSFDEMVRGDILQYFENDFYSQLTAGYLRRRLFHLHRSGISHAKKVIKSLIDPTRNPSMK